MDGAAPQRALGGSGRGDGARRASGGDGGLDGLAGPGVLLASPDKKKRKSNTQPALFPPVSEYAPPPNPSADHLVASNPFDDSYNALSFKPLPSGNPYPGHSHYPGLSSYAPHRMPPHVPPRIPSPYGGPYQLRSQLHPFAQNQMGMGFVRVPGFGYPHPESPAYGNQPGFNSGVPLARSQPYRASHGDAFSQGPPQMLNRSTNCDGPAFGPEGNVGVNVAMRTCVDPRAGFALQRSNQQPDPPVPKQELGEAAGGGASHGSSPQKQGPSLEESPCHEVSPDRKSKGRNAPVCQEPAHPHAVDKLNGIISPSADTLKNSPQPCGPKDVPPRAGRRRQGSGGSKTVVTPSRPGPCSSDPIYPCGICLNEVNDDQEAIMCEASCQKWFHRICTGMTETAYNLLTAEASAVWGCDICMEDKGAQLLRSRDLAAPPAVTSEG
ncbi:pygopus homolog 1 isoform X1 [Brienomyrus brachyistius]|uniref:pygopus homolog 1 isoform X1 n=1 Tax=Brienomyrus brachyistius TaxID=42636 RepID=UPI0020B3D600|nr:pygopus homolog 1 isoform X1 [Brienomyrus brachyistius]